MKTLKTNNHKIIIYDSYKKTGVYGLRKWINALKSGKFKQGNDLLYNNGTDCYCCIGVYETVVHNISKDVLIDDEEQVFLPKFYGPSGSLKTPFMNQADCCLFSRDSSERTGRLPDNAGYLLYGDDENSYPLGSYNLAFFNDSLGLTFDEIADLLDLLFFDVS